MKEKLGMALAIFVGMLLLTIIVAFPTLQIDTNLPTVLAIVGATIVCVWAVTNAQAIAICLEARWLQGKKSREE